MMLKMNSSSTSKNSKDSSKIWSKNAIALNSPSVIGQSSNKNAIKSSKKK